MHAKKKMTEETIYTNIYYLLPRERGLELDVDLKKKPLN
jgi:hypothetical protein